MAERNENGVTLNASAIKEAVNLGQKLGTPNTAENIHFVVVPLDSRIESLASYQYPHGVPPDRIKATVGLRDAASFVEYVTKYRDSRTRVFAEPTRSSFLAVLDYHQAEAEKTPEFCDHKASFVMTLDDRWKIWLATDNKPMAQDAFAEFIEDQMADIADPRPADMLEIARDLKAKIEVNFGSSTRSQSGQVQLKYEETVKAGVGQAGTIEIPEEFTIKIPVFYGETAIEIKARLRFRIASGKLSFHYRLNRPNEVQLTAFEATVESISGKLGAPILLGSPA